MQKVSTRILALFFVWVCLFCSLPTHEVKAESSFVSDSYLTTKVKMKLGLTDGLAMSSLKISVATNDGVVTLKGKVSHAAQRSLATYVVQSVEGVAGVNNELTVGD